MSIDDFMEGIHIIQDNYHKKLSKAQLNLFYDKLKDMNKDQYISNIKEHIKTNPYIPNVAQILKQTNTENTETNIDRINLNSSYWYINLRQWCDENNIPYYDITTGKPLTAYKGE